jgi:DeoR/GlpR family transcriptional regulator of sugar metabolism
MKRMLLLTLHVFAFIMYFRSISCIIMQFIKGKLMTDLIYAELPDARRQVILDRINRDGRVITGELRDLFGLSEDTIRRDLREMAKAGLLTRVHGGALPVAPVSNRFNSQHPLPSSSLVELAKTAASLLERDQVIFFDGGTTNLEISKQLDPALKATAITISPQIAVVLSGYYHLEVVLLGGQMNAQSLTTQGAAVLRQINDIRADVCLLGVCSIHPKIGLTAMDYEETQIKQRLVQTSVDTMAVVSADKFGTAVPFSICSLKEISYLVTDKLITEDQLLPYRQAGIEIYQS